MAIVVHMRASFTEKRSYGRQEAMVFLDQVMGAAPDVTIQIAHLAGAGGGDDPAADEALAVFIEAIARADPRASRLWFDVTGVVTPGQSSAAAARVAAQIRQVGLSRILYGSDAAVAANSPREAWTAFRRLPLTPDEFTTIATNVAPYLRDR
jgi:predicted TIM-barrel fold metal-dependent hydrolase